MRDLKERGCQPFAYWSLWAYLAYLTKEALLNQLLTMISATALLTAIVDPAFANQHEKTVFVTKASFKGNLGGLAGADEKCQAEADDHASIVPSGTYLAWLSDGTNSPDTRFAKSSDPYVLPDGTATTIDSPHDGAR